MQGEWLWLICAWQFLTRLPAPRREVWPADWLGRSAKYFPLVGGVVGGLQGLVLLAGRTIWSQGPLPALLAVGAGILITGALHEDGLADTADGLGGGHSQEQRLAIMKDSRIGSYGVLALGLTLAAKIAALGGLPTPTAVAALIGASAGGRAAAVLVMTLTPYATNPEASKLQVAARSVRPWEAGVALASAAALAAVPIAVLTPIGAALIYALAGSLGAALPALAAQRLVRGHTGDVLGAVEQMFELFFILAASGLQASGHLGP